MKNFAVSFNSTKDINESVIGKIKISLRSEFPDCNIIIYKDSEGLEDESSKKLDILLVLGGDGTILRAAGAVCTFGTPILGINTGNLGYLSSIELKDLDKAIIKIKNNEFHIENRLMLECKYKDRKFYSLNDVVVSRGCLSGVSSFKVYIDDNFYADVAGDGLIISTPTGSTAYNISAGGPIIYPNLKVLSITPICSHYVGLRPLIIDGNSKLRIETGTRGEKVYLMVDGNIVDGVEYKRNILVQRSDYTCHLIKFHNYNYYNLLKNKILGKRDVEGELNENRTAE